MSSVYGQPRCDGKCGRSRTIIARGPVSAVEEFVSAETEGTRRSCVSWDSPPVQNSPPMHPGAGSKQMPAYYVMCTANLRYAALNLFVADKDLSDEMHRLRGEGYLS